VVASLTLTPVARRLAWRLKVLDNPDGKRKLHKTPVPLLGGVAVYLSLLVALTTACLIAQSDSRLVDLVLVLAPAAGFVCLMGCVDDRWDLHPRLKLLLQISATLPIALAGFTVNRVVIFGTPLELGWLGVPLTVFWLVGCINALNLLDGLDGLASVVGLSTALMMSLIASNEGHPHVSIIAVALAGALVGFLAYNLPPASIYLGDSGSMVIGLVVGMLAIQGTLKTSATMSITAPAVVMSIPMFDTLLAIVRRKLKGQRFDVADRGHIHHRLLDRGLSNWQVLCVIGSLCLLTGAAATFATLLRNEILAWVATVTLIVFLVRMRWFGHHELMLVKLLAAAGLARLGHWLLGTGTESRAGMTPAVPDRFDEAWSQLIRDAASCQASSIELTLRRANEVCCGESWSSSATTDTQSSWSLTVSIARGEWSCELAARGLDVGAHRRMVLPHLLRLMEARARHWAGHPEQLLPNDATILPHPANLQTRSRREAA
jgi:UDP-GlcNAc:undecaprenyl-phosphate/decaprenyl-phosphate GlcNAc-1-phosphate transferase